MIKMGQLAWMYVFNLSEHEAVRVVEVFVDPLRLNQFVDEPTFMEVDPAQMVTIDVARITAIADTKIQRLWRRRSMTFGVACRASYRLARSASQPASRSEVAG